MPSLAYDNKAFMGYVKFISISLLIGLYLVSTSPFLMIFKFAPFWSRSYLSYIVAFFSRLILAVANINISIDQKEQKVDRNKSYFIVSNHLSYLDILVLSSYFPSSFITSVEMKETPLLGEITTLAGCVFVERRSKENINNEISEITMSLKKGLNIIVFPESTSMDGKTVYPFKRSMFQAAIDAKVDVLPLIIEYKSLNNEALDKKNKDVLYWYDETPFLTHFLRLCKQKSASVTLHVGPLIRRDKLPNCSGDLRDATFNIIYKKFHSLMKS